MAASPDLLIDPRYIKTVPSLFYCPVCPFYSFSVVSLLSVWLKLLQQTTVSIAPRWWHCVIIPFSFESWSCVQSYRIHVESGLQIFLFPSLSSNQRVSFLLHLHLNSSSLQATEPSIEDLNLDKKESEVEVSLTDWAPVESSHFWITLLLQRIKWLNFTNLSLLAAPFAKHQGTLNSVFPGGEGHHRSAVRKPARVFQAEGESHDHQLWHLTHLHPQDR